MAERESDDASFVKELTYGNFRRMRILMAVLALAFVAMLGYALAMMRAGGWQTPAHRAVFVSRLAGFALTTVCRGA